MLNKTLYVVQASDNTSKGTRYFKVHARTIKGAIRKATRCNRKVYNCFDAVCVDRVSADTLYHALKGE